MAKAIDVAAVALREFEGHDVQVDYVTAGWSLGGFYGRLVDGERAERPDGAGYEDVVRLWFDVLGDEGHRAGFVMLDEATCGGASWHDIPANGQPSPSGERCLVVQLGGSLEVHLCRL